jgi:osmotically-inducible protein OsmY
MAGADAACTVGRGETALSAAALRQAEVLERLRLMLHECHYPALRRVTCELYEGVLVLRGRVPSYYQKQLAQAMAARCAGVEEIVNKLEVMLSD